MSQRDNFSGGFLLGVIVGGLVGGVVGSIVTARRLQESSLDELSDASLPDAKMDKGLNPALQPTEKTIEAARRRLEDKIAQLNDAIDTVRQQLGTENGKPNDVSPERSLTRDC